MPILFGWGFKTVKVIGVTFKNLCGHCHNEEFWVLTRTTTWFTLFFIPVIPYSVKHFFGCPVCQYGVTLDKQQLEEIKPLAETNQLLIDGKITEREYQARTNRLHRGSPDLVQSEVVETKTLASSQKDLSYCGNCGT